MKENRIFTVGVGIVAIMLFALSLGRLLGENAPQKYKISIVVDRSSSTGWDKFRKGLNAASKRYNIEYNFVTSGRFLSIQQEYLSLSREIKNGADGIITELRATEGTGDLLNELGKSSKLELVNCEKEVTDPTISISSIGVDEEALGEALGREVLQSNLQNQRLRIGILAGNQNKGNMRKRLEALKKVLEDGEKEIVWIMEDKGQARKDLEVANHKRSVDIIIALDNDSLEIAARYLRDTGRQFVELYGVGDSDEAIYSLDAGMVRSLIVIDQYAMAYSAVVNLWQRLSNNRITPGDQTVDFYVVRAENMYTDEMERILFPTGQ